MCKIATCNANNKIINKDGSCSVCANNKVASPDGKDCVEAVLSIYNKANTDTRSPPGLSQDEYVAYMESVDPSANANDLIH